jgi:hypothetical protein
MSFFPATYHHNTLIDIRCHIEMTTWFLYPCLCAVFVYRLHDASRCAPLGPSIGQLLTSSLPQFLCLTTHLEYRIILITVTVVVPVVVLMILLKPLLEIRHTSTHLLKTPFRRSTIPNSPSMNILLRSPMVLVAVLTFSGHLGVVLKNPFSGHLGVVLISLVIRNRRDYSRSCSLPEVRSLRFAAGARLRGFHRGRSLPDLVSPDVSSSGRHEPFRALHPRFFGLSRPHVGLKRAPSFP